MTGSRWTGMLLVAMALAGACPAMALDVDAPGPAPGNPLWAIPLDTLSATRERPIFSPSRRPPPEVGEVAPPAVEPAAPLADAVPAEHGLTLVGTIAGPNEGFGIFLLSGSQDVVRLRTGEAHAGWVLQAVKPREATLSNGEASVTLSLPANEAGEEDGSASGEVPDAADAPNSTDEAAPSDGEDTDTAPSSD